MNSYSSLMFFQDFGMIPWKKNGQDEIFKNAFAMILVIIKLLFDLEITYENKNALIEIQQSLLNDNFTKPVSCFYS